MHCIRYSGRFITITRTWICIRSFQQTSSTKVTDNNDTKDSILRHTDTIVKGCLRPALIRSYKFKRWPNILEHVIGNSPEKSVPTSTQSDQGLASWKHRPKLVQKTQIIIRNQSELRIHHNFRKSKWTTVAKQNM